MAVRLNPLTSRVRVVELPGEAHPRLAVAALATGPSEERAGKLKHTSVSAATALRRRTLGSEFINAPPPSLMTMVTQFQ
jgi:hypothetical protein